MGIQICSNKGAGPFWGPIRGKIRNTGRNALIFGTEHPWGKEIQVCSHEVPGVINGHALRGHNFTNAYIAKTFKNLLLMNDSANFNQTWWETCLRDGDSDLFKQRGWAVLGLNDGQNKEKFDKH